MGTVRGLYAREYVKALCGSFTITTFPPLGLRIDKAICSQPLQASISEPFRVFEVLSFSIEQALGMLLSCTHLSHRLATHFGLLLSSLPPHSPMTKQELLCPPENRTGAVINKILLFIKIEVTGRVAMCQRNIWNLPLLPRALKATERDGGTSVKSDLNIRVANVS